MGWSQQLSNQIDEMPRCHHDPGVLQPLGLSPAGQDTTLTHQRLSAVCVCGWRLWLAVLPLSAIEL